MRIKILQLTIALLLISPIYAWNNSSVVKFNLAYYYDNSFESYSMQLYDKINENDLNFEAFNYGLKGYLKLINENNLNNSKYLTIIDMSLSANEKRLFIINMETQQVEHKSLVAHGRSSGGEFASKFSNIKNSHQSSIGFYRTAETYIGKHGYSMRLDGLEYTNSNARERAIVIHEADYVSYDFIKRTGRLGRSYGCPSLPQKNYKTIINKIKNGSCLFIYYPKDSYISKSKFTNSDVLVASSN